MTQDRLRPLWDGIKAGIPIGVGYYAVAFSLGIAARSAGISPIQGFVNSLLVHASAGERAGITAIAASAPYWETALVILIANVRYLLMSTAMSQRLSPSISLWSRFWIGFLISDEIFAVSMARKGPLDPWFAYGAGWPAFFLWAGGTASGIIVGNLLPETVTTALGVALYGMFLAVIVPSSRANHVIFLLVLFSFGSSWCLRAALPAVSEGSRTILLTVLLAGGAALIVPVPNEEKEDICAE